MKLLKVIYYEILRNIRDWKAIVLLLLAPLLTIAITGNATKNTDTNRIMEKTPIVYYNADNSKVANQFNELLKSDDVKKSFDVSIVKSYDEGYSSVVSGKAEALIYIPANFSDAYSMGKKVSIEVFSGKQMSAARILVEGFVNKMNTNAAIGNANNMNITMNDANILKETAITVTEKTPNALDRWTYLNMTLFLFYGAILGSISIINGLKKKTYLRMNTAPVSRFTNVGGIFLGNTAVSFLCTIIIMVISKYLLGSNWDGNFLVILTAFLLFSAIANSIGIIFGCITKSTAVSILIVICVNIFLGNIGVSSAIDGAIPFPQWMLPISPHYFAYKAVVNDIFTGPQASVTGSLISLAVIASVTISIMFVTGRRKSV